MIQVIRDEPYLGWMEWAMEDVVMGHEVLYLLHGRGGRMNIEALRLLSAEAFGTNATFGNCHGDTFDFDGLLRFLSSRGKVSLREGHVELGPVPACSHS